MDQYIDRQKKGGDNISSPWSTSELPFFTCVRKWTSNGWPRWRSKSSGCAPTMAYPWAESKPESSPPSCAFPPVNFFNVKLKITNISGLFRVPIWDKLEWRIKIRTTTSYDLGGAEIKIHIRTILHYDLVKSGRKDMYQAGLIDIKRC